MGTFRLRDFALTSCSAGINAKSIRWNSSSVLHGVGAKHYHLVYKNANLQRSATHHGMRVKVVFMCTRTHLSMYICIHVHMNTFKKGKTECLKEERPLYYNKVEGRENEG